MTIELFDTAQRAVVPFEVGPVVRMYVCGITPYDSTHLGHAATYLTYDLLIRRLEELGHEVRMVRNVTDVDDSILPKARELGVPYLELAEAELARFRSDMDALGTRPPVAEPRAATAGPAPGEVLPPVAGGAVMGLCAAVALLVFRDIQRARRAAPPQSLASASS